MDCPNRVRHTIDRAWGGGYGFSHALLDKDSSSDSPRLRHSSTVLCLILKDTKRLGRIIMAKSWYTILAVALCFVKGTVAVDKCDGSNFGSCCTYPDGSNQYVGTCQSCSKIAPCVNPGTACIRNGVQIYGSGTEFENFALCS
ncbi:hypothetical protein BST61_g3855 [Cercospora zeina]